MKNKLITFIITYFFLSSFAFSQEFIFKTKKIEITENGKFINAAFGTVSSDDGDLKISANEFKKRIMNITKDENLL